MTITPIDQDKLLDPANIPPGLPLSAPAATPGAGGLPGGSGLPGSGLGQ
ncbi:MAG: hypothetical protein JOZ18_10815 [Chloroflexi bacterium]|nr:hypothetical protein [Chloroflexota bacterium]